ncbi:MAG: site-2 protease family protein [Anaerolineales bacterium]|jgi:Zn-dependent protease/predicted transcriptional regulator
MKWQWKLARIAGIDVYMHATFLFLIGWVAITSWTEQGSLGAVLSGIFFILLLFAFVVMHEYGHALTARRFGIKTRDITLYPIGGVARLERMPEKPIEELWVALAGPAVNVVIAIVLFGYLIITRTFEPITSLAISSGPLVERLMVVNLWLVGFNLIPAFPMDGGRVLRALLGLRLEYVRATQIAAYVGQGFAFLFGILGFFSNPFLVLIAIFVWMGAGQEANMVRIKHSINGIPVTRAMQTDFMMLTPYDTLSHVVGLILAGSQHDDFPVVQNGYIVGILDRDTFMKALSERGQNTTVAEVMRRDITEIDSQEKIEAALTHLQENGSKTLPVTQNGQLVGLISSESIKKFLMLHSALRTAGGMA